MEKIRFRQVHQDFHTSELIPGIGRDFDPEEYIAALKKAHVNNINTFAKCHHGMLYFDTDRPEKHPHLQCDLLREQLRACHAAGITAPIYVSVGFDVYAHERHPEWLQRDEQRRVNGPATVHEPGWQMMCFNSPYADYLAEQMREIMTKFQGEIDGMWFDILFQSPCYCDYCRRDMKAAGMDIADPRQVRTFTDGSIRRIKERLTGVVHEYSADCQLFFNTGHVGPYIRSTLDCYSHLELESLPSGGWGYEHYPITARYARLLGKETLGMTGRFHKSWADFGGYKSLPALEYECFTMLSLGAKCCIGDQLHPTGKINKATYDLIGAVYEQVEAKEPWCCSAESVTEIGVLMPEAGDRPDALLPELRGAYRLLEEEHLQFDFLDDVCDFSPYQLLILPDSVVLHAALKAKLERYLQDGGKLLLTNVSGMDPEQKGFALEGMGVTAQGHSEYATDYIVAAPSLAAGLPDTEYVLYDPGMSVAAEPGTEVLSTLAHPYFNRTAEHFCSHFATLMERRSADAAITQKGNIIYCTHPLFGMIHLHGYQVYKKLLSACIRRLLPRPLVAGNAPTTAHITLNHQPDSKRYVAHILHYIPERRSAAIDTIDDIIPLYNVSLRVRMPAAPRRVYLAPQEMDLSCMWKDGYASVTVPEVHGHQMVVFEE